MQAGGVKAYQKRGGGMSKARKAAMRRLIKYVWLYRLGGEIKEAK